MTLNDIADRVGTLEYEQQDDSNDREVSESWDGPEEERHADVDAWDPQA